ASVDFEGSIDGRRFVPLVSIRNDVPEKNYGVVIKDFVQTFKPKAARYVRVRAHTYGRIPAWHPGKDGDAWIFVDEIIVN
ncbi:MAG: hypothetical protein M3539_12270, partial [Acidobacteriota bacterium]|nr:hypothetical protein [Acidobacteriota bacterium]